MPLPRRLVFLGAVFVFSLLPARAELRLLATENGRTLPVVAIEDHRVVADDGGTKVMLTNQAVYSFAGELAANPGDVMWPAGYQIRHETGHLPTASIAFSRGDDRRTVTGLTGLADGWADSGSASGLLVLCWMAHGKVDRLAVTMVPSRAEQPRFYHDFVVADTDPEGHPVALYWMNGKILPARPRFTDAAAQRALAALTFGMAADLPAALNGSTVLTATGWDKVTLLHLAAAQGNVTAVDLLVQRGAALNARAADDATPLVLAASNSRTAAAEHLIAAGAKINVVTAPNGETPLIEALRTSNRVLARLLVEKGADVDAEDLIHDYPLGMAINRGDAELARLMLPHSKLKNFKDDQMRRVLSTQATLGHTEIVRFLLEQQVSAQPTPEGRSILQGGAIAGDAEMAKLLLGTGAKVDETDADLKTALMVAASAGNVDYARALLAAGAKVALKTRDGRSVLHFAVCQDKPEITRLLLDAGADPAVTDAHGITPLDLALVAGSREIAALLAARGARLNLESSVLDVSLQGVLRLDLADLLARAIADGWLPESRLAGNWPPFLIAQTFSSSACLAVLRRAGVKESGDDWPQIVSGRDITAKPTLAKRKAPVDPRGSREIFPASAVRIKFVLDEQGRVQFPVIEEAPDQRLRLAALDAINGWQFNPAKRGDRAVCVRLEIPLEFPGSEGRLMEISDVDVRPQPLFQQPPRFPNGIKEGAVTLRFVIQVDGSVQNVEVVSSSAPELNQGAIECISRWRFKPALVNGVARACLVSQVLTVNFQ